MAKPSDASSRDSRAVTRRRAGCRDITQYVSLLGGISLTNTNLALEVLSALGVSDTVK